MNLSMQLNLTDSRVVRIGWFEKIELPADTMTNPVEKTMNRKENDVKMSSEPFKDAIVKGYLGNKKRPPE
jgi:hypothetical protein